MGGRKFKGLLVVGKDVLDSGFIQGPCQIDSQGDIKVAGMAKRKKGQ